MHFEGYPVRGELIQSLVQKDKVELPPQVKEVLKVGKKYVEIVITREAGEPSVSKVEPGPDGIGFVDVATGEVIHV